MVKIYKVGSKLTLDQEDSLATEGQWAQIHVGLPDVGFISLIKTMYGISK